MDFHYIVDKLNDAPFQYGLSLLSLSEKSSQELLQLLSDVFSKISPRHQHINVSKEDPDQTADRLVKFLKIVKYKPPASVDPATFRAYLATGDKDTIFQILKWVVPQPQELQKRAFVGHYLSFPDMPEEFNYDADIMELKEEIKMLQSQFIEVHRSSEGVKSLNKDTAAMKKRIKSLEEEKERLNDKVAKAKSQVDKVADRANYMDVCSELRKEQDEEVSLSTQLLEQKKKLEKAEAMHAKAATRVRDLQTSYQEGSAGKLLETLTEEVNSMRAMVGERYPRELEKRQKRVQALQEALSGAVNTEVDLQRLQHQANALHTQIQEVQERRAQSDKQRAGDKKFMQLRQAQQMATMASRKKSDLNAKLERLQEKKATLTSQYEKLTASDGSVAVVSEEEWRAKYESMKAALPAYKKMKKELGDIEAEVFVLAYTEELLVEQESALNRSLERTARKQGVAGFTDIANDLEKVSEQKSVIDEAKGMTLQEISRTVEEINGSIADRKVRGLC
uniref:IFT81 calponin homology domain-containing protein n=1 Tax=Chlamydomonas euryale TaxID=1486919 RepID=A0A7R9YTN5_9CHLO|mmetsp:Transcript_21137/g.63254  ORF Transcript_21137/g.63254 Transcript_21137/m.63254 type:complete len:507 (+) Transcript_21137:268-1788(+)